MARRVKKRSVPMRKGECRFTPWTKNKKTGEMCRVRYCKDSSGKVRFKKNSQECR